LNDVTVDDALRAGAEQRPGAGAERRMDWFDEGVVPVLEALHREHATTLPLNVPAGDALPGSPGDAIVEVDCRVSRRGVWACAVRRARTRLDRTMGLAA